MKINDYFSSWSEILFEVSQGSTLGSLLSNIFVCYYVLFNYAGDSTPFSGKLNGRSLVDVLEIVSSILFTWLKKNYIQANTGKSCLLFLGNNSIIDNTYGNVIKLEDNQVLLGITNNSNLSFNKHINNLYKKASAKFNAPVG